MSETTRSRQFGLCPSDRALFAAGGSVLLYLGLRSHAARRFLFTALGAELIRRGLWGMKKGSRAWREIDRKVDEMSMQSFPASDPPAY